MIALLDFQRGDPSCIEMMALAKNLGAVCWKFGQFGQQRKSSQSGAESTRAHIDRPMTGDNKFSVSSGRR